MSFPPLAFLLATLAALVSGPALYAAAARRARAQRWLDAFVMLGIAGLIGFHVVPEVMAGGGWPSAAFLLAGLVGPSAVEQLFAEHERRAHLGTLAVAMLGLLLHTLADGAVLAAPGDDAALPLAIVLHSLPVGVAVWWLIAPPFGRRLAAVALGAMCAGTVAGYVAGSPLEALVGELGWSWFEAFVSGMVLHVVFGRPHLGAHGHGHSHGAHSHGGHVHGGHDHPHDHGH